MSRRREAFARWALLCALAWGVLAMHHLGSPETGHNAAHQVGSAMVATDHAMHAPAPDHPTETPPPAGLHDLLHLCMAVICAVGIALTLRLLRRVGTWSPVLRLATRSRAFPAPARPPPAWGRELLHSVCVLRV